MQKNNWLKKLNLTLFGHILFFSCQLYSQADSSKVMTQFNWANTSQISYDLDGSLAQATHLEKCNCLPTQKSIITSIRPAIKNKNGNFITQELSHFLIFYCPNGEIYQATSWPLSLDYDSFFAALKSKNYSWFYYCLAKHFYFNNEDTPFLSSEIWNTQSAIKSDFLARLIKKQDP
jgi:hypothetical protein